MSVNSRGQLPARLDMNRMRRGGEAHDVADPHQDGPPVSAVVGQHSDGHQRGHQHAGCARRPREVDHREEYRHKGDGEESIGAPHPGGRIAAARASGDPHRATVYGVGPCTQGPKVQGRS
jgi:hypothetical protein